jgi:nucleotide-binding universal stress UspA family protein
MPTKAANPPILVPVDFSANSEQALLLAAELAACMKAPLTVLHVVHDPGDAPGYYARRDSNALSTLEDIAAEMMDEFLDRIRAEHPELKALKKARPELVSGLPVNRILEVAERIGPRLLVIGSRGRTGLSHLLLGSKAEQVVRLCPVPVTIVKMAPDKAQEEETQEDQTHAG